MTDSCKVELMNLLGKKFDSKNLIPLNNDAGDNENLLPKKSPNPSIAAKSLLSCKSLPLKGIESLIT